jgi:hypothetical protein
MRDHSPTEKAEAASVRRRWINLGEVLAVAGVAISGLALWNNYAERSHSEAAKAIESRKAESKAATLTLRGTPSKDQDRLTLATAAAEQSIQSQTITFPKALGLSPAETTGDARIEAGWFDDALKKARRAAKAKDETAGDERLPVAITTRFLANGDMHEDIAIYDVGYALEGRFLGGSTLKLRGLSLVGRTTAKGAQVRLDSIWNKRLPAAAAS